MTIFYIGRTIDSSFENKPYVWRNPECIHRFVIETISESVVFKLLSRLDGESNLDILDFESKLLKIASSLI